MSPATKAPRPRYPALVLAEKPYTSAPATETTKGNVIVMVMGGNARTRREKCGPKSDGVVWWKRTLCRVFGHKWSVVIFPEKEGGQLGRPFGMNCKRCLCDFGPVRMS